MRRILVMATVLVAMAAPGLVQAGVDPPLPVQEMLQLLQHQDLKRELKLDAPQREALDAIARSLCITSMPDLDRLTPEARKAKIEELLDKADLNISSDAALARLFTPEQQARFTQIKLHWLDIDGLRLAPIADALALTEEQRLAIAKKLNSVRGGGLDILRRDEIRDAVWDILTPEQEEQWEKLAGPTPDIDQVLRRRRPSLAYASQRQLLRYDSVQEELHLSAEQGAKIAILVEKMRLVDLSFLAPLQNDPVVKKKLQQLDEVTEAGLTRILSPEQLTRFQQLRWQRDGDRSLDDPKLAERLEITAEQREKFRQLHASRGRGPGPRFSTFSDEERREYFAQSQKFSDQLRAVLTPEQQQKWEQLLGPKFGFSRPAELNRRP